MRKNQVLIIVFLLGLVFNGCNRLNRNNHSSSNADRNIFTDSLWIEFAKALENRNINFLESNSIDSIKCSECFSDSLSNYELYDSKQIFENHLDKLLHLKNLTSRNFETYQDDSIIRISYFIEARKSEEGGYNLIYLFEKRGTKYLFGGMVLTP